MTKKIEILSREREDLTKELNSRVDQVNELTRVKNQLVSDLDQKETLIIRLEEQLKKTTIDADTFKEIAEDLQDTKEKVSIAI